MNEITYNGFYLGIVVQNNDPEKRGRVKVYIPHVAATLYKDWNETFKSGLDKHFAFLDKNTNPDIDKVLQYLKETLPWAEIAQPIFGGSASGRYHAHSKVGSTSDSNYWDPDGLAFGLLGEFQEQGFRPAQNFMRGNRITDAFSQTDVSHNRLVNPNANQYVPSDYSNLARGVFSIPNVGSHVWLFFLNGDSNYPVVFASSSGQEDWLRIYTKQKSTDTTEDKKNSVSPDYPDSYENLSSDEKAFSDHNIKTFRSKHVINSNKHVFEMVDTDLAEILKMTHYSGSFLEFNNNVTTRLATNNDQLLVIGDQFITVRKNQSIYVANYQETIIDGDRVTKLGDFTAKRKIGLQILAILKDTHKYKRLFESTRTPAKEPYTSPLQTMAGAPAICPVCAGAGMKFGDPCITCGGSGLSPSTQDGMYGLDPNKWPAKNLIDIITKNQKRIIDEDLEAKFGNGGDDIEMLTGNRVTTIGTVFNDMESFRVDPIGKIRNEGVHVARDGTYVSMGPAALVEYVDVDSVPGGDWDITVGNKYTLSVGAKGIHIKTNGPVDISGTIMNISAESLNLQGMHEVLIGSGFEQQPGRVEIKADVINLKAGKNLRGNVLVDGQLGVANNMKVVGGAHIEGELSYLHSTTPYDYYMTEIGFGPVAHVHKFKAPPWTLLETCSEARMTQDGLNQPNPLANMKCPGFWVPG